MLHDTRRVPEEFLMELVVDRRSPCSYLCDHFSLDGREFSKDGSGHRSFLKPQDQQNLHETYRIAKLSAAATLVDSRCACALEIARQPGAVLFSGACNGFELLRRHVLIQTLNQEAGLRRVVRSTHQMKLYRSSIGEEVEQLPIGTMMGNTCNSHGHVSFAGNWTYNCDVNWTHARGWEMLFPSHAALMRRLCVQRRVKAREPRVSYRKRLRERPKSCISTCIDEPRWFKPMQWHLWCAARHKPTRANAFCNVMRITQWNVIRITLERDAYHTIGPLRQYKEAEESLA
ncbi:hypothetical protein HNQ77_001673 [Silvibacterium bohemicum]|uniref:Uncharacterized protein n=1 Tax=Silvibacterium bohemicum TaxID=1577686 RepID=A0A841K0F6_9BACT|nr:hypothetical protein [Silvibacterium bohemicum]